MLSSALKNIETKLALLKESEPEPMPTPIKKGTICAGQHTDGEWYRVKIEGKEGEDYLVFFMEFGNVSVVWFSLPCLAG